MCSSFVSDTVSVRLHLTDAKLLWGAHGSEYETYCVLVSFTESSLMTVLEEPTTSGSVYTRESDSRCLQNVISSLDYMALMWHANIVAHFLHVVKIFILNLFVIMWVNFNILSVNPSWKVFAVIYNHISSEQLALLLVYKYHGPLYNTYTGWGYSTQQ